MVKNINIALFICVLVMMSCKYANHNEKGTVEQQDIYESTSKSLSEQDTILKDKQIIEAAVTTIFKEKEIELKRIFQNGKNKDIIEYQIDSFPVSASFVNEHVDLKLNNCSRFNDQVEELTSSLKLIYSRDWTEESLKHHTKYYSSENYIILIDSYWPLDFSECYIKDNNIPVIDIFYIYSKKSFIQKVNSSPYVLYPESILPFVIE